MRLTAFNQTVAEDAPQQSVAQSNTTPTSPAATAPAPQARAAQPLSPFDAGAPSKPQTSGQKAYQADGFSMAQVLGVLGKASQDALRNAGLMQLAANKGEIGAKQSSVSDTKAQVRGEQISEGTKFAGAALSAGAASGMAYKGAHMTLSPPSKRKPGQTSDQATDAWIKRQTTGTMLDATSKAITQPITETTNTIDKLVGGAHEADQAKIALKIDEVNETIAKQQGESAKQGVQQAQEAIKNVNSVRLEHLQRWEGFYGRI